MDKEAVSQLVRLTRFRLKRLENQLKELEGLKKRVERLEKDSLEFVADFEACDWLFGYILDHCGFDFS